MSLTTKKAFLVFFILISLSANVHADFFGDIVNGVGNFINDAITTVVNVVSSFVAPIVNAVSSVWNFVNNVVSSAVSSATAVVTGGGAPTPRPPQGGSGGSWEGWGGTGGGGGGGGDEDGSGQTYYYTTQSSTREIKATFAQLELTNLYYETIVEDNKVYSGVWVFIYSEITNVGSDTGNTKFRIKMDCRNSPDISRGYLTPYESVMDTEWMTSGELKGGRIKFFNTQWRVPKEKYQYGGDCKVKAEVKENVRKTTIIENVFCTIITWITGDTSTDCTTTKDTSEEVLTMGETERDLVFNIEPSFPKLGGKINVEFFG